MRPHAESEQRDVLLILPAIKRNESMSSSDSTGSGLAGARTVWLVR